MRHDRTNCDLFFVTLEKSEPLLAVHALRTTRSRPSSSTGSLSPVRPSGRQPDNGKSATELGGHVLLFVRPRKRQDGRALPYTFLGPADLESFRGERPISCVWRLRRSMPAGVFREAKVAAD